MTKSLSVIGVGVGPGDPTLLTLQAINLLQEADLVLAPTSIPGQAGRAESIVRSVLPELKIERIQFDMSAGNTGSRTRETAAHMAAVSIAEKVSMGSASKIAFLTLGDPNVYSTFGLMAKHIKKLLPEATITTSPGIMAFQAVLSDNPMELTDEDDSLVLLSGLADTQDIEREIKQDQRAVVIYKGGSKIESIIAAVKESNRYLTSLVGIEVGLSTSKVIRLSEVEGPLPYLSTVVIPPTPRS